ncbi:tRNA pseudouridine55 synthase [Andreprevotia lacus DSM 23236]|jgi:tRNA pseudouridine55 synthase|uniref:tRNA pseudouridine synthase B n=1 Tax=Andreprevotia lacus DSM 23236 TaxID=1121001 RepID=A0A1W1X5Y5_9NEIS|nr:tRNA pseudouridine(55) synthase TruB [Andreprevotia lacus]SMC19332.1 tRNA pseudouridine55 synthase [Andreprevotia lacus DSM 23236]
MAKRKIDGVLLLDKPFGISSNNALQKARWLLSAEKAGHTGVLDPFATGLLPLCFGEATKFSQRMLDADKGYRATIKLGEVSTTLDGEGEITVSGEVDCDEARLRTVLASFLGEYEQMPPMHSALKFQGKALYEYARQGVEIERQPRRITFYELNLLSFDGATLVLDVLCSKGTYIRVLADDIGKALGCGAYLAGLIRTRTAGFLLEDAVPLDTLIEMELPAREAALLPVDSLVNDLPQLALDAQQVDRILHGMPLPDQVPTDGAIRLYGPVGNRDNARFIGLGEVASDGVLRPKRLLAHFPD